MCACLCAPRSLPGWLAAGRALPPAVAAHLRPPVRAALLCAAHEPAAPHEGAHRTGVAGRATWVHISHGASQMKAQPMQHCPAIAASNASGDASASTHSLANKQSVARSWAEACRILDTAACSMGVWTLAAAGRPLQPRVWRRGSAAAERWHRPGPVCISLPAVSNILDLKEDQEVRAVLLPSPGRREGGARQAHSGPTQQRVLLQRGR